MKQAVLAVAVSLLSLLRWQSDGETYSRPSTVLLSQDGRVRGFQSSLNESDFYLGGLVRVHISASGGGACDPVFDEYGIQSLEAMLFSIDCINSDDNLLPNITLGFDIRDTCKSEAVALDESLDWIQCSEVSQSCIEGPAKGSLLAAVVGATSSSVSIPIASFFRLFAVPQVSYISTSPALSNKMLYSYFLRIVPSDITQAQVMIDIIKKFGWTIISIVHSSDAYGEDGATEFQTQAESYGICIDINMILDVNSEDYFAVAETLAFESTADVVVGFASKLPMVTFFQQLDRVNSTRTFTWIASDAWSKSQEIQDTYGHLLIGSFGLHPHTSYYKDFNTYYSMLTPSDNLRNPWFGDYCKQILKGNCTNTTSVPDSSNYTQNIVTPLVVDAVYSIAHGLDNFLKESCDQPVVWNRTEQSCVGQTKELNGSVLLQYISSVNFTSPTEAEVFFDSSGDGNPVYEILNLQKQGASLKSVAVAKWDTAHNLVFNNMQNGIQFGTTNQGQILMQRQSECTSCQEGSAQITVPSSCCTYCMPCTGNLYLNSSHPTECEECDQYMWGASPLNGSSSCVLIDNVFLSSKDAWGIALLVFASIGILLLIAVSIGLGVFWGNQVIKSFGREQLILLMTGLSLCFVLPVVYVIKPSPAVCAIQQLGLWFALTQIFAALLVKLIRITRIFLSPAAGAKRRCISPWQQVVFTLIVVFGQMVLVIISLVVVVPKAEYILQKNSTNPSSFPTIAIICKPPHNALLILNVIYETALIIMINALGVFTLRFPKNFNESKYIAFSTFAVGVVWLAFIPAYFATNDNKQLQAATIALTLMMMALCILLCMIIPRLYTAIRNKSTEATTSNHSRMTNFPPSTDQVTDI